MSEKTKDNDMPELLDGELPAGVPVMTEAEEAEWKRKNKKKKMIAGISIFLAVGIISGALLLVEPFAKGKLGETLGMYGSNKSYNHYPADYDLDVTTVKEYMELDRDIHMVRGGETYILDTSVNNTPDIEFFIEYFDCAINGRYEEYNDMFTARYYKTNEPYIRFAPQMIYDIKLEKLSESYSDGKTHYTYNVTYRIYKNNGTFRNDIGSDGAKTLFFGLIEDNGVVKIDRITYYV